MIHIPEHQEWYVFDSTFLLSQGRAMKGFLFIGGGWKMRSSLQSSNGTIFKGVEGTAQVLVHRSKGFVYNH